MGRKGTVNIIAAGWDPREATDREALAILRMGNPEEYGPPGVQDFIAVENLCNRCHGVGCLLDFDEEGLREEWRCPGHCECRDEAWRAWGMIA